MADDEIRYLGTTPDLREPVLLAAFGGWNDAGQAATYALQTLINAWSATRFAEIDPEEFFDFSETRPNISLDPGNQRSIHWPENSFHAYQIAAHDRDIVLLMGTEPNLRWKRFCRHVLMVADQLKVSCLVTLGALLADVPHTRDPILTGFASTPKLLPQLKQLGVQMSSYEGPTGIVGALHEAWRTGDRPAISLWANVPHYIAATPNPEVSLMLLRRVSTLLGTPLPLQALENHARIFASQVDEALQENPEALEYVHQLEEAYAEEVQIGEAPNLFEALEGFLRTKRPPEESGSE